MGFILSGTKMSPELQPRDGLKAAAAEEKPARPDCETVLTALDDSDCRALLEATADGALTAAELIDRCDVPRSTTYRKLDQLTEPGCSRNASGSAPTASTQASTAGRSTTSRSRCVTPRG